MIVLNSVSKTISRGRFKRTLLEDVSWAIEARTQVVILGDRHSGAPALLNIIGGLMLPSSGWVERRSTTSIPGGLLRYVRHDTTHQLVARLSRLYRVDQKEITDFVAQGVGRRDILNVPPRSLPAQVRQQVAILLNYAFPVDFYLFESTSIGVNTDRRFQLFCERAFELRSSHAGIIMLASTGKVARRVSSDMMGALVYRGSVTLYKRLADAIMVFESLPPERPSAEHPTSGSEILVQNDDDILAF
ncbi:hypothetical protein [Reyranella sp.]|uniref:hypothetical protein n=1 Tax=Reyranella sp. TaxID=1929291 RepID=UPI003C7ED22B